MEYKQLGKTGEKVFVIGLGTYGHGEAYGGISKEDSFEVLNSIVKSTPNYANLLVDTAPRYGDGMCEKWIGEFFNEFNGNNVLIATKGGRHIDRDRRNEKNFSSEFLKADLDKSLKRLRANDIFLYQLHNPPLEILTEGSVFDLLEEFRNAGKIRFYGVSIDCSEEGIAAIDICNQKEYDGLASIQVVYNILNKAISEKLFRIAQDSNISIIARQLIGQGDEKWITTHFRNTSLDEKHSELLARLRSYLSAPNKYECSIILGKGEKPLSLFVTGFSATQSNEVEICLLRVGRGTLVSTFARQIVRQCLLLTQRKGAQITKVTDKFLEDEIQAALYYFGFFETLDGWTKISLPVAEPAAKIADRIMALGDYISVEPEALEEWVDMCLRDSATIAVPEHAIEQEHLLWPAKIADAKIPTYIVPIEPRWAQELFDEKLASNSLFGRKQEIAINTEAVYYRSARGKIIAPGRILWYVSSDSNVIGAMNIRACSRLEQVEVGLPKELYRKYKRLGIYEWKHVYKTAHFDINQNIMALKFSNTELFPNPFHWKKLQKILKNEEISSQIQQPLAISGDIFLKIYSEAAELTKE